MENKKKPIDYVDKEALYLEMIRYKQAVDKALALGVETPRVPECIGRDILLIAQKLATHKSFIGYTTQWKQEMINDGVENVIQYINNFDPDKTNNPFAYFTMVIWRAFIRRIHKEKKQQYIKAKNLQMLSITDLLDEDMSSINVVLNDSLNDLINVYEKPIAKKTKEKKVSGVEKYMEKKNE